MCNSTPLVLSNITIESYFPSLTQNFVPLEKLSQNSQCVNCNVRVLKDIPSHYRYATMISTVPKYYTLLLVYPCFFNTFMLQNAPQNVKLFTDIQITVIKKYHAPTGPVSFRRDNLKTYTQRRLFCDEVLEYSTLLTLTSGQRMTSIPGE